MKGAKEILMSFTVALAGLLAYSTKYIESRTQEPAEPVALSGAPADSHLSLNWGLEEVHARATGTVAKGQKDVIVAVIDTGCDVHHPDLRANIWRNPGEEGPDENGNDKASNGIDDDGNGYVDDVHGWNFVADSGDLSDNHGHGTHIAGIIGGPGGVAPRVSLMILKYFDTEASGLDNLTNTIAAIRYAVNNGANIINYSGGGNMKSREEEAVLRWAAAKGVLVVAAAGNEGINSDFFHFYPADYELPNILAVGAIDRDERLMRMSNYGMRTVAVAAPGRNIYSTLPNGQHGYMSGTSQATAFATGVAALLYAQDERFSHPQNVIEHLVQFANPRLELKGRIKSGGVLDAELALSNSQNELAEARHRRAPAQAN